MCTTRFAASAFGIAPSNGPTCTGTGNAPAPSYYAQKGQAASSNALSDLYNLYSFRRGGALDAQVGPGPNGQPFGGTPSYANYTFGVYMAAAGYTLGQTLAGADIYGGWPRSTPPPTLWVPHVSPLRHGTFAPQRSTPITVRTPPHAASTTSTLPSLPAETDCGCTPPRRCHPRNTLPGHPSVVPPQTGLPSPGQPHHPQPPAPATRPSRPDTAPPQLQGSPTQSSRLAASLSPSPLHLPITSALAPSKLQSPSTHPMERQSSHQGDRSGEKSDSHRYSAIILPLQHHPGEST